MTNSTLLRITALCSIVLASLHLADDFAYGKDVLTPTGLAITLLILAVWLVGAFVLADRLAGYLILLLGSLFGVVVPYLHLTATGGLAGGHIAQASGPAFFVWTLISLGGASLFSLVLSLRGLWGLRARR